MAAIAYFFPEVTPCMSISSASLSLTSQPYNESTLDQETKKTKSTSSSTAVSETATKTSETSQKAQSIVEEQLAASNVSSTSKPGYFTGRAEELYKSQESNMAAEQSAVNVYA